MVRLVYVACALVFIWEKMANLHLSRGDAVLGGALGGLLIGLVWARWDAERRSPDRSTQADEADAA